MRSRAPIFLLVATFAVLAIGLAVLFRLRVAQGDVFPPYSSLRADPLGTRALHDALENIPGVFVSRQFKPIPDLAATPPRTIIMAGVGAQGWSEVEREEFDALNDAVRGGSRLVLTFRAQAARTPEQVKAREKAKEEAKKRRERSGQRELRVIPPVDLKQLWGADVGERLMLDRGDAVARRADDAAAENLPETIPWRSDLYFALEPEGGWRVLYRRAGEPVLVERPLGRGSLVLAADSFFLSNEGLQRDRSAALLAWIVGPHARIEFDEAHLGVMAQPGVAALARRYGLAGAFFTLLLLAALFVWQRMALFVPPPVESHGEVALTYHPAAGLEALLRRSVATNELTAACVNEWRSSAREGDRARADAALAAAPKDASPVSRYNAIVRALRRARGGVTKDG